jgi:hypothetical protein
MAERLQKIVGTDAKMVARVGTWLRRQGEKLPHEDTLKKFVKLFRLKHRAAASLTGLAELYAEKRKMNTAGKQARESAHRRKTLTKEESRQLKLIRAKWLRRAEIVKKK